MNEPGTIVDMLPHDLQAGVSESVARRRMTVLALAGDAHAKEDSRPDSTRGRVLQAAISMFAERGFESCTMRDLAGPAGVKAPALYNHFASKEDILAEAMSIGLGDFYSWVLEPLADAPPEQWLELIVRRHTLYQLEHDTARASELLMESEALSRHLPESEYVRMRATQREYVRLIRSLVAATIEASSEDEATVATYSVVAMCNWVKTWYRRDGNLTPSDIADRVWQLVGRMLGQR
ncbi:MAG: TetR/AcrR family transcriptional regulator [Thermoleophilia bacterium]|nr:TetR/AcrR family transcriptional regulator [Thermoleophilia bacterium]